MANTTTNGIVYPTSGDNIAPLETHFATLAQTVDAAITDAITGVSLPNAVGKNFFINGGFEIWQRGNSITLSGANSRYSSDRWEAGSGAGSCTISPSTDIPSDVGLSSLSFVATGGTNPGITQRIESASAAFLAGKQVTLSVWAKSVVGTAGIDYACWFPNTKDDWSSASTDLAASGTLTASMTVGVWTRYTATFTPSANAVKGYGIRFGRVITAGTTETLYAGAQLELGSTATAFSRNTANIQQELASCQRYCFIGGNGAFGIMNNATTCRFSIQYPVTMRTEPTVLMIAPAIALHPTVSENQTSSKGTGGLIYSVSGGSIGTKSASKLEINGWASGVDGRMMTMLTDSLEFNAEL